MMKYFLPLLFAFLQACSFAKDNLQIEAVVKVPLKKEVVATNQQKNVLAAAKSRDLNILRDAIDALQPYEYFFAGHSVTPMSEALAADNVEAANLLFERGVDPYNLGSASEQYFNDLFYVKHKKALVMQNQMLAAQKIQVELSRVGELISGHYSTLIAETVKLGSRVGVATATSEVNRSSLNCDFFEIFLVQEVQLGRVEDVAGTVKILKDLRCERKWSVSAAKELYQLELIRQFRVLFAESQLLGYLSHRSELPSTLWNIDNSGIWVAPSLLMRIAWSADNVMNFEKRICPSGQIKKGACVYDSDSYFGTSDRAMREGGVKESKYELIYFRNGQHAGSYRRFVRQVGLEHDNTHYDILFLTVGIFMSGKEYYSYDKFRVEKDPDGTDRTEPLRWRLGLQLKPENMITPTDELDNAQWVEREEAEMERWVDPSGEEVEEPVAVPMPPPPPSEAAEPSSEGGGFILPFPLPDLPEVE
ncbi:hypothetical protein [Bdellovibrio bacteriovorus]|uniref:Uncharacterized protein n=1 Tax=Bdellovibrio bacteriovorus str. Tiberius TaxID=1069642 RepID=K7Z8S4_BDEBC|nr:hypothetical protein [Bdellovibrio bacteriovorus]AFY00859.1 hypothetical protein Bdt_1159 [Bdellovibrio bacteriovorus str. Tiberius]